MVDRDCYLSGATGSARRTRTGYDPGAARAANPARAVAKRHEAQSALCKVATTNAEHRRAVHAPHSAAPAAASP
jgi:hypothetical protein